MSIIGALLGLILFLVIVGVVFWAIQRVIALIPLAEPFATLVNVALVLIGVAVAILVLIWLLNLAGVHVVMPHL